MILPLVMAYILFAWINAINNEQRVKEYVEVYLEKQKITEVLKNPSLYTYHSNYDEVESLVSDSLTVTLYNDKGRVIYAPESESLLNHYMNSKVLYRGLYSLEQGYRAFTYKEPVYDDNNTVIGFFEVNFSRNEWTKSVSNRMWFVISIFIVSFISIYFVVILLVNKKLNVRISQLMNEMSAFAKGETLKESETGEDEIGELQKHFYDMRKQINLARETIAKEQETKAYMIAAISHDLKTPLTSIKAYAEMLETDQALSNVKRREYERIIIEKADFMKQMLDDLLTYTLLQSPSYEMELVIVDGEEFFDMLVSGYELLCEEKGIRFHVSSYVSGSFQLNPKQLMRVSDNLMSNAIKHTEPNARVWISAYGEDGLNLNWLFSFVKGEMEFDVKENVYLIVQNDGKGIERAKLKHLFDPLYQVDQARSKKDEHGTGLGLSITKQIIEKHGGAVYIFSEVNIGTCIVCRIPKYKKGIEQNEK